MVTIKCLNPPGMGKPIGPYMQVNRVRFNELVFMAGQVASDAHGNIVGVGDLEAQCAQVYANIETALRAVGAGWGNIVHFTNYLVNRDDLPKFVAYRRRVFPGMWPDEAYPPNTLLFVDRLVRDEYLVEVEAIAAI